MASRSTFVTVFAWLSIIGSGFASLISLVQVLMVSFVFSDEMFQTMPHDAPAMAQFMGRYFHLLIYGFATFAAFTLVTSIALLKRHNWARLAFMGILVFGIVWQLGGLVMQGFMMADMSGSAGGEGFEDFERMSTIIRVFTAVIAVTLTGVFAWVIKKLASREIAAEFKAEA